MQCTCTPRATATRAPSRCFPQLGCPRTLPICMHYTTILYDPLYSKHIKDSMSAIASLQSTPEQINLSDTFGSDSAGRSKSASSESRRLTRTRGYSLFDAAFGRFDEVFGRFDKRVDNCTAVGATSSGGGGFGGGLLRILSECAPDGKALLGRSRRFGIYEWWIVNISIHPHNAVTASALHRHRQYCHCH